MENPRIYVASLSDYNNGRLEGKWFDLSDYSNGSELMDAITEMLEEITEKYNDGEVREEWAVHDYEYIPSSLASEYMGENDFQQIYDIMEASEDSNIPFEVLIERVGDVGSDDYGNIAESLFLVVDGNDETDIVFELEQQMGALDFSFWQNHIYIDDVTERVMYGEDVDRFREDIEYENTDMSEDEIETLAEERADEEESRRNDDLIGYLEEMGYSDIPSFVSKDYESAWNDLSSDYDVINYEDKMYVFSNNYGFGGKLNTSYNNGGGVSDKNYEERLQYLKMMKNNVRDDLQAYRIDKEIKEINTILEHRKNLNNSLNTKFDNGGGVGRERFNLFFNYNPSNISNEDAEKIVKQYTNDWKHNNDFDNVSFYVFNLTKEKANELKALLKMEDVFNIEIEKSSFNYGEGGWILMDSDTERKIGEYETESEARKMMYEYEGDSVIVEKSKFDKSNNSLGVDDYISMKRLLSEFRNEKEIFDGQIVNRGANDFKIKNDNFYIKRPNQNWEIFRKIKFDEGGSVGEEKFRYKDFYQSQGGITFETEEQAERFIKTKPFVRKQLREGNFVLVFNGKEYFIGEKIKINDEFNKGGVVFTNYNGMEIMYEPNYDEYFVNDEVFYSMEEAKNYIDKDSRMNDKTIDGYRSGAFNNGGAIDGLSDLIYG